MVIFPKRTILRSGLLVVLVHLEVLLQIGRLWEFSGNVELSPLNVTALRDFALDSRYHTVTGDTVGSTELIQNTLEHSLTVLPVEAVVLVVLVVLVAVLALVGVEATALLDLGVLVVGVLKRETPSGQNRHWETAFCVLAGEMTPEGDQNRSLF